MTQKEELAQAQAKIEDLDKQIKAAEGLQSQLAEAQTQLKAAEKARDDEKANAAKIGDDLKAANARADKAENDLKAANDKVAKLEAGKKSTDGAAAEQLAARGVAPQAADQNIVSGTSEDTQALVENFLKASMSDKVAMLAKHGDKLRAAAAATPFKG